MSKEKSSKKDRQKAIQENQEVLATELAYIGQTAFQTNEDRQRVAQFFFISFGSFIAAILSLQIEEATIAQKNIFLILGFVFLFVAIFGVSTLLQLTRLREAWLESVQAMNALKAYVKKAHSPHLDEAFAWLKPPAAYKPGSVGYYQAIQIALGTGVASGASLSFFLASPLQNTIWNVIALGVILSVFTGWLLFTLVYKRPLQNWRIKTDNE